MDYSIDSNYKIWDKKGMPHKGWICIGFRVQGDATYATCDMCGNTGIKYVHILKHQEYSGEIKVGCTCAGKLQDDYLNPRKIEKWIKSKPIRQKKFLKLQWVRNSNYNYVLKNDGIVVTIMQDRYGSGNYGLIFEGNKHWKIKSFAEAKKLAFELIDNKNFQKLLTKPY